MRILVRLVLVVMLALAPGFAAAQNAAKPAPKAGSSAPQTAPGQTSKGQSGQGQQNGGTLNAQSLAQSAAQNAAGQVAAGLAAVGLTGPATQAAAAAGVPDYKAWEKIAKQAETALAGNRQTLPQLESLRARIAEWRRRFQEAQDANKTRIATLQSQIASLGPAPAKGATESPEIAKRRKELEQQLATLQAPGIAADEAFSRADGIIREIDAQIRARQARALLQLWPAPINPANWPAGWAVLSETVMRIGAEIGDAWASYNRRAELRSNLPVILGLLAFAVVLMARGGLWMERLTDWLQRNASARARRFGVLLASLGQIVLPLAGVLALVQALLASAMTGPIGQMVLAVLPAMGLTFFAARWLGGQLFPRNQGARAAFRLPPERQAEGRIQFALLGLLFALDILRRAVVQHNGAGNAANAVLSFPLLALSGLILFRLGQLMRQQAELDRPKDEEEGASLGYRERLSLLIGRAVMVVALVAPLLGAVGYIAAASAALYPTALSLALLGTLVVAQHLIEDVYRWITMRPDNQDGGLVPVLAGFVLIAFSVPLFALVWGAREADLVEIWNRFGQGFSIGSTHISPTNFLTFAILFVVGYSATRLFQAALKTSVLPKTKVDLGGQNAIVVGMGYLGIVLSALIAITAAGIDLSSLAIVAGALSVGIGFGLQNIVSNFVSGLILLIERPVSEGDWIDVGGLQGTVRSISVRSTRIETFDRADVIVPNSNLITGVVTNMTKYSRIGRLIVPVGVAYGTDTRRVDKILRAIAEDHPMVVVKPPPSVVFAGFGADSLNFEIRVILRDVNFILDVKTELNHQIAEKFAVEGIEIPFAQRDIWLRNPEALRPPVPEDKGGDGKGGDGKGGEGKGAGGKDAGDTGPADAGSGAGSAGSTGVPAARTAEERRDAEGDGSGHTGPVAQP